MQATGRMIVTTFGAALLAGASLIGTAGAHDGHDHGGAQHGGAEAKTKNYHFEAVFTAGGVKLYAHGAGHKELDASKLSASATFYHPNTPDKPWFSRELKAARVSAGHPAESLDLAIDLSKVPAKGAKVSFRVGGLPDPAEPTAEFTVPFALAKPAEFAVAKATKADQAAVGKLKTCPVSGEDLFAMGGPLKVSLGDRSTFICCKGCLKKIQAEPDKYLGASASSSKAAAKHEHHDDH